MSLYMQFRVVGGDAIREILMSSLGQAHQVIRDAYIVHEQGGTSNPHSLFLRFTDNSPNRIIALPAYLATTGRAGVKWISSFPANIDAGLPRASAVLVVNDSTTGYPIACLEATAISTLRTAMSAAICAEELLSSRYLASLSIIGAGELSAMFCRILAMEGWVIEDVYVHDVRQERARKFAQRLARLLPSASIETHLGLPSTIARGQLIVFATTASDPYVSDLELFEHNPVVLHLSLRDLDPAILMNSQNIVDDRAHVLRERTSLDNANRLGTGQLMIAGTIGDLLLKRLGREGSRPSVVSPFGLGMLDLALGSYVYDVAASSGVGVDLPSFFPSSGEFGFSGL
jgi:N-[(2S)-2-amino-2-carboxyethyl]-L-glutamate dehydrogenase